MDRLYKNNATMDTYTCSGLQLAKQLDSLEDIVQVTEVVDSAFGFLPSQVLRERG